MIHSAINPDRKRLCERDQPHLIPFTSVVHTFRGMENLDADLLTAF